MRRVGVPQVVRMKISGHKTDSMERRCVDAEDLSFAKELLERRMKRPEIVTKNVTITGEMAKPGDTRA